MNLLNIELRVADNIRQLSSDGVTVIDGVVTSAGIRRKINDIYLEDLFQMISDKFPTDFIRQTYPKNTYTASGAIGTIVGTTLTTTADVFDNSMEGFQVQNSTVGDFYEIQTYVSATQVILESAPASWVAGQNIYVLGNEFILEGDMTDYKELFTVSIKYSPTDGFWRRCQIDKKNHLIKYGTEKFTTSQPYAYPISKVISGVRHQAIGIRPTPTRYDGRFIVEYMEQPSKLLLDADEPVLKVQGLSEVIIHGVTAWAFMVQKKFEDANYYRQLYEKGKTDLIRFYKPSTRADNMILKIHPIYFSRPYGIPKRTIS